MTILPARHFRSPRILLASLLGVVLLLSAANTSLAVLYMKIAGLTGEVTTSDYAGDSNISSLQYNAAAPATINANGSSAGKVSISDVTVTRTVGSTSPTLFLWLVTGKVIPTVDFYFVKTTASSTKTYMQVELTNAYVTSQDSSSGGDLPTEALSFAFQKITITFTPDGTGAQPVVVSYDLTTTTGK